MIIGQTTDVSFNVNVMGTAVEPKVRVVFMTTPALMFPANKVGDNWKAEVYIPESVSPCQCMMKVEVLVNNRMFVPLTKSVELVHNDDRVSVACSDDLPFEGVVPVEEAKIEGVVPVEAAAVTEGIVPLEVVKEKPQRIIKLDEETPKPQKKIKLPKDFFKVEAKIVEPVKIHFAPIVLNKTAAVVPRTSLDRPLANEEVKPRRQHVKLEHSVPLRLIKGEVVYE